MNEYIIFMRPSNFGVKLETVNVLNYFEGFSVIYSQNLLIFIGLDTS